MLFRGQLSLLLFVLQAYIQDVNNYHEELVSVAVLARLLPWETSQYLTQLITMRMSVIVENLNQPETHPQIHLALKQVDWLLHIAGCFLCDDPGTEVITIPDSIHQSLVDVDQVSFQWASSSSFFPFLLLFCILSFLTD
jgi:hypothetical protein